MWSSGWAWVALLEFWDRCSANPIDLVPSTPATNRSRLLLFSPCIDDPIVLKYVWIKRLIISLLLRNLSSVHSVFSRAISSICLNYPSIAPAVDYLPAVSHCIDIKLACKYAKGCLYGRVVWHNLSRDIVRTLGKNIHVSACDSSTRVNYCFDW